MRVLERACWRRCGVELQGALRVLLLQWYVRFGAGLLVLLQTAASGCC